MYKNLAAAFVAACCISSVFSQTLAPSATPLKIGFVYVAPVLDAGWVHQHDEARKVVEAALGDQVKTTYVENVAEGADAERVIRDLAQQGHQLIFTPSFGYMEPTLKVAKDFPNVKFESITGYKTQANVAVANARYYEGRYLAGIAAGRLASSAGYVAGFAIPEVIQGINAFTLGMRSVNPQATVKVVWLGAWFDPPREREAAMTLFNQGVDVMAFHTGSTAVMSAAQERGKLAIAYHSDMRRVAPDAQVLWLSSVGAVAINPALYDKLSYDPARDLAAVSLVVRNVEVLVVPANAPYNTGAEFVAAAKRGGKNRVIHCAALA